ncbi:MAG: hypothetical protein A2201_13150 [Alicyclobacillus sp. RIFOXYA1_FULL_53_8]|nr:MAG: hypothetical protein A2201_13150 [Alicyclobacillus sp. RIFOXYA1_FULL_53_8]
MLTFLLVVLLVIAVVSTYLRKKAVRWLFTLLAILFWLAFLSLFGFVVGFQAGTRGIHLTHLLF